MQCIRSFIVIRPNKSFADGSRSFCPETLPASLPLQSPFLQSRKYWTVPETSSPTWCPTGRASRAWALQLWVLVPGTAAAAAVPWTQPPDMNFNFAEVVARGWRVRQSFIASHHFPVCSSGPCRVFDWHIVRVTAVARLSLFSSTSLSFACSGIGERTRRHSS